MTNRRKLSAILSADAAGYSRLMADDEAETLRVLNESRVLFRKRIEAHAGRLIDTAGDSILAEFPSAVEAVDCAAEIQHEFAKRNSQLAEHRRMPFRVGINLGDVIEQEDGTIYGDGVNVAARLQQLAEPGGICISGTAFDHVGDKLPLQFKFIGEQSVKNIAKPVRAYRVLMNVARGQSPLPQRNKRRIAISASVAVILFVALAIVWNARKSDERSSYSQDTAVAVGSVPAIAVLPFVNMSGDSGQEYFADGITETIITDLSKLRGLKVIARNSVFTYKGKAVDVRNVSRELGVRYVLEGSVQKAGDRIRITTQLIDATTGEHVWAERYDRPMQGLFVLQDEISTRVVTEMDVKLAEGENAREWRRTTNIPEAYDYFLRARQSQTLFTRQDMARARQFAEKALALDPKFAMALWMVGQTHYEEAAAGWAADPQRSFEMARAYYRRAIELDGSLGIVYAMLGAVSLSLDLDHARAVEYAKKAINVNPNGAFEYAALSLFLAYSGDAKGALLAIDNAFQRNPIPLEEAWYYHPRGFAFLVQGKSEEAITNFQKCLDGLPDYIYCNVQLTAAYMLAGEEEKARTQAKQVLRVNPGFSVETSVVVRRIKDADLRNRIAAALRRTGLP